MIDNSYTHETLKLVEWFITKLQNIESFTISNDDFLVGTDALPESLKPIITEAFDTWLDNRQYELSYSQLSYAFFTAAKWTQKMVVE